MESESSIFIGEMEEIEVLICLQWGDRDRNGPFGLV